MAQFSYSDYEKYTATHKASAPAAATTVKFFKLADGDEALVRINCGSINDLRFASVHPPVYQKKYEGLGSGFTPVSCLFSLVGGDLNVTPATACPFCRAAEEGHEVIQKAVEKVYVEMLVAYRDPQTGGWAKAVPVVWERPAGFSRELANKLKDYGDLREYVFKISRTGSSKDTRYTFDFIPPLNKPEIVPKDFSAFNTFNPAKHSYWELSAAEMQEYLKTNVFTVASAPKAAPTAATVEEAPAPVTEAFTPAPAEVMPTTPVNSEFTSRPAPAFTGSENTGTSDRPVRNFSGFSF